MNSLEVKFGALVDLINACQPDPIYRPDKDEDPQGYAGWQEAISASMRAVAVMTAGGYQVGQYRAVFDWLHRNCGHGRNPGMLANLFLDTWGHA